MTEQQKGAIKRRAILVTFFNRKDVELHKASFSGMNAATDALATRLLQHTFSGATYAVATNRDTGHSMKFVKRGRKVVRLAGTFFKNAKDMLKSVESVMPKKLTDEELAAVAEKFSLPFTFPFNAPNKRDALGGKDVDLREFARNRISDFPSLPEATFEEAETSAPLLVKVGGQATGLVWRIVHTQSQEAGEVGLVEQFAYMPFAVGFFGEPVFGDKETVMATVRSVAPKLANLEKERHNGYR